MKIRQLEAFRAVMLHQTVTLASEMLHISQPATTRLLADLESSIRIKLFDRVKGRLLPTLEAQALFREVELSLIGIERIARAVDEIRGLKRGTLQIAAAPAIALSFLPHAIADFTRVRPDANVSLTLHSSRSVIDMVIGQRCDVGFVVLSMDRAGPNGQRLFSARHVCALPIGHKLCSLDFIQPSDLACERFIAHPPHVESRLQIDAIFAAHGLELNVHVEAQVSHSICAFVEAGAGVAIIDSVTAWGYPSDKVVFKPFKPSPITDFSVITPAHRPASLLLKPFVDHVQKFARTELGEELIDF